MGNHWNSLKIRNDTKLKIKKEVRNLIIKDNPELKGVNLTYDYLINRMIKFFLNPKV